MSLRSDFQNILNEYKEMREHPKDKRYRLSFRQNLVDMLTERKYFAAALSIALILIFNPIVQKSLNVLYFDGWQLFDGIRGFISLLFTHNPRDKLIDFINVVNLNRISEVGKSLWKVYISNSNGYRLTYLYATAAVFLGSIGLSVWFYNVYIKTKKEAGKFDFDVAQKDIIETPTKVEHSYVRGTHANGTDFGEMPSVILGDMHYSYTLFKLKYKPQLIYLDWEGLRTSLIITGTTSTGKTHSGMYSIVRQLIEFMPDNPEKKTGMLVLDVKGDFYKRVLDFAKTVGRLKDVRIITLGGKWKYNPLHKPEMLAGELASRVIEIARARDGISKNSGDTAFWENQGRAFIENSIRLARLHSGYVNFKILDYIIRQKGHGELLSEIAERYENGELSELEEYDYKKVLTYFTIDIDEGRAEAAKVMKIVEQTIQPMINSFLQEKIIEDTFSPNLEDLNFFGFEEMINEGLIVCLKMDTATYPALSPFTASYLALDFQKTTLQRIKPDTTLNVVRPLALVCDECHFMMSPSWGDWLSVSRQSNTCGIFATQSYQSLYEKMNENTVQAILQNINNKVWLGSEDDKTLTDMVKTAGKYEKVKVTKSINETALKGGIDVTGGTIKAKKSNVALNTSITTEEKDRIRYEDLKTKMPEGVALINVARIKDKTIDYKKERKLVSLCYLKNWKVYGDVAEITDEEEYELIYGKVPNAKENEKIIEINEVEEKAEVEAETDNEEKSTGEANFEIDFDF